MTEIKAVSEHNMVGWHVWMFFSENILHFWISPLLLKWHKVHFKNLTFKLILQINSMGIYWKISHVWAELTDVKSTLIQVMAWCQPVTSHYVCQCWLRCMSLYGVTRPQWVKQDRVWIYAAFGTRASADTMLIQNWPCDTKKHCHFLCTPL